MPQVVGREEVSLVRDEFGACNQEDIPKTWYLKELNTVEEVYDRIDSYLAKVFGIESATGDKKYKLLARVVKSAPCIHDGNADVEWSLQDNKNTVTDERTRLSKEVINCLRLAKDFIHAHDDNISKVTITKQMVEAGKSPQYIQAKVRRGERGS